MVSSSTEKKRVQISRGSCIRKIEIKRNKFVKECIITLETCYGYDLTVVEIVTCIFIYISVTFIVLAATMFMVNKNYQKERRKNTASAVTIWSLYVYNAR